MEALATSDSDTSGDPQSIPVQEWCSLIQEIHVHRDAAADGTTTVKEDNAIVREGGYLDTLNTMAKCLAIMLEYGTYQVTV